MSDWTNDENEKRKLCTAAVHIEKTFPCKGINCNMRPLICENCAYISSDDPKLLICKMCRVTERM